MIDESNLDTRFRRNFIRLKVLPLLEQINPSVKKNIYRTSKILQDDLSFIESEAEKFLSGNIFMNEDFVEIPLDKFNRLHTAIQRVVLRKSLKRICNLSNFPDFSTIERIRNSIITGRKSFVDRFKIFILFKQGKALLSRKTFKEQPFKGEIFLKISGTTKLEGKPWMVIIKKRKFSKKFLKNQNPLIAYVNAEKIKKGLVLTPCEMKSRFVPLGMKKEISFKKYWKTHKKKILSLVEQPLVIRDEKEIVWVVGGHISWNYAIEKGCRVIEIRFEKV